MQTLADVILGIVFLGVIYALAWLMWPGKDQP